MIITSPITTNLQITKWRTDIFQICVGIPQIQTQDSSKLPVSLCGSYPGTAFKLATNRSFITAVFYGSTFATITDVMNVIPISAITLIAFLNLKITLERELSLSPTRT